MSAFTKDLDALIPQMTNNKTTLVEHLVKNYKEGIHYIITKPIERKHGGHNKKVYLLTERAFELLKNSYNLRNRYITDCNDTVKQINIGMCIENQTIGFIMNSFDGLLSMKRQYYIGKYKADLFIEDYKLVIECDENNHDDRDINYEITRQDYIITQGHSMIRFNPNTPNFDLSNVLREIHKFMFIKQSNPIVILV